MAVAKILNSPDGLLASKVAGYKIYELTKPPKSMWLFGGFKVQYSPQIHPMHVMGP